MRDCYSLGASNALVFFSEQLAGIAVICFGRLLSTLFAWFLLCYNIISAIFLLLFPLSIQCMKKEREREGAQITGKCFLKAAKNGMPYELFVIKCSA